MNPFPPIVTTLSTIDAKGKRIPQPCAEYTNTLEVGVDWYFTRTESILSRTHRTHLLVVNTHPRIEMNIILAQSPRPRCLTLRGEGCVIRTKYDLSWIGATPYTTIDCPISFDPVVALECESNPVLDTTTRIIEVRHSEVPALVIAYLAPTHLVMRTRDCIVTIPESVEHVYVDVQCPPPMHTHPLQNNLNTLVVGAKAIQSGWLGAGLRALDITLFLPVRMRYTSIRAFEQMIRENPGSIVRIHIHERVHDPRVIRMLIRSFVLYRTDDAEMEVSGAFDGQLGLDLVRFVGFATHITRTHEQPVFAYVDSTGVNWCNVPIHEDTPRITETTFENIGVTLKVGKVDMKVPWVSRR